MVEMEFSLFLLLLATAWASPSWPERTSSSQCSWDLQEAVLECRLKPSDSGAGKDTVKLVLARHQTQATLKLRILCQDMPRQPQKLLVDYEGSSPSLASNPWPHLQSLHVENCPLASIGVVVLDGLSYEKKQGSDDVLQDVIQPLLGGRSLSGLRHLSLVNVSQELSSNLWCEIVSSNLISLNLSSNGLDRLPRWLPGSACSSQESGISHLEVLNLSNNAISRLVDDDQWFQLASTSLTHLDVSRNRLQAIRLGKMQRLVVVDVSDNKLSSAQDLMEAIEASSSTLQELHAQGNQMERLPNLFSQSSINVHFHSLLLLNLSRNALQDPQDPLEGLLGFKPLVALDLSHNKLTKVDDHLFSDLVHLQVLSLAHNQIVRIGPQSLDKLTRIHVLVLSHNNIDEKGLGNQPLFQHMSDLRTLSLDHNRLKTIPRSLFEGCTGLRDLSLAANFLRQWPASELEPVSHHLHTLDMGENSLRSLGPLTEFKKLYGLRLAGNRLRNITADSFGHKSHLKMLNVADNLLEFIDIAAFEPLKHLRALRLDNNRLEDINGLLTSQRQLQWLNISHNHLQWIDYALIPKSVIWLSLRHNRIEELGNYYNMQEGFHLTHLDIGHNALTRMDRLALQPSLKEVIADHNQIVELAPNTFSGLANLTGVDLTHNRLRTFPLSALTLTLDHGYTLISMSDNPLECDCQMEWILRINSLAANTPREFPRVSDWSELRCSLNNRKQPSKVAADNSSLSVSTAVSGVRPSEFLCSYETHCFALCMCCDFFACDCRMKCSDGCHCFHDQTWSSNIIECGQRGHDIVPEFIPMDATAVYLDGNAFVGDALLNDEFIGRKHMTSLYLNASQIEGISNQTFKGLTQLLTLHLEDNALSRLESGQEFDELIALRELYLHNNALEYIHPDTLRPLFHSLQVLTLHGNRLKVDFHVWEYIGPELRSLSLRDNQWTCQCDFVEKLHTALKARANLRLNIETDVDQIQCLNQTLRNSSACADVLAVSFRSKGNGGSEKLWPASWDSFVPVLAVTVASAIIVISLIILAVAARKPLRSWFQRRYDGIQRSNIYGIVNRTGQAGKYDILVIACPHDQDFVRQILVGQLESQNYHVILHSVSRLGDGGQGGQPLPPGSIESCNGVCVVASHSSSYIQNSNGDLLTLSKRCQDLSRPLVLVALETGTAKTFRQMGLQGRKILLWDTKSFWPSLRATIPPSTISRSSQAVKKSESSEKDTWTYVRKNNGCTGGGDSSVSTQSTDTMTATSASSWRGGGGLLVNNRRSSTLQRVSQPSQMYSHHRHQPPPRLVHQSLMRLPKTHVIENPMMSIHQHVEHEEEPIYHSLDEGDEEGSSSRLRKAATAATADDDDDVTVYINADLEVVYPSLPLPVTIDSQHCQRGVGNGLSDDNEEELNGLLADCYENEESLLREQQDYVPSPAPGSCPRGPRMGANGHLSYNQKKSSNGYLV